MRKCDLMMLMTMSGGEEFKLNGNFFQIKFLR